MKLSRASTEKPMGIFRSTSTSLDSPLSKKILVVGDGAVGKTSILQVFVEGRFPLGYTPTLFENYVKEVEVDGRVVDLKLWDSAGQEEFDRLRTLSYPDTDCIMLCFAVDQPASLENVESKWIEETTRFCPDVKICLVATKCDLRDDPQTLDRLARANERPIIYEEGLEVAKRISASRYLELSAKENRGVREAMYEAARVALANDPTTDLRTGRCCVVS